MDDEALPEDPVPPAAAPHEVRVPVNIHRWERIAFLHWRFPPSEVQRLLPDRLRVLVFDGSAWVGLTPFRMHVRPPGLPFTPRFAVFPETNLRTYVAGPDGRHGLWFLHMEATARWFVAALRSIGLPYVHRRMEVDAAGDRHTYRSARRDGRSGHDIVLRAGRHLHPPEGDALERFLTARWDAYHRRGGVLLRTPVAHPPWRLRSAHVEVCDVAGTFSDGGLPAPRDPPLAHLSPGVTVRVGPLRPVRAG